MKISIFYQNEPLQKFQTSSFCSSVNNKGDGIGVVDNPIKELAPYRTQYSWWAIKTRYTQLVSVAFPYLFAIWKFTIWKGKVLRWLYHSMILSPLLKFFLIWAMRLFQNVFWSGKCVIFHFFIGGSCLSWWCKFLAWFPNKWDTRQKWITISSPLSIPSPLSWSISKSFSC